MMYVWVVHLRSLDHSTMVTLGLNRSCYNGYLVTGDIGHTLHLLGLSDRRALIAILHLPTFPGRVTNLQRSLLVRKMSLTRMSSRRSHSVGHGSMAQN